MKNRNRLFAVLVSAALLNGPLGCKQDSDTGALIGAGAGAGGGALIGSAVAGNGKRTQGALIGAGAGALVGGTTGYLIGRESDKDKEAARRREQENRYYNNAPPAPTAPPVVQQPQAPAPSGPAVSTQDVILWTQRGIPESIIIDRVQRSSARFNLSQSDYSQLRSNGVSESVIRAMAGNH